MMTITDVTIADRYADDEMRARVVAAANEFAERHNLTVEEMNAILNDEERALFDLLDGALRDAANAEFIDDTYVVGEISNLR